MRTFLLTALLWSLPLALTAQEKKDVLSDVEILKDVPFGTGGGRPLKMHIIRPKVAPKEPMPVAVWVHGGGWYAGNKDIGFIHLTKFALQGYFCASIEYRLSGEAPFPAQIHDCKCAIRFLRAKAKEYHLDPNRIGVMGMSAGGHLVALLGTAGHVKEFEGDGGWPNESSRVQAVCDFCGPTDLNRLVVESPQVDHMLTKLFAGPIKTKAKLADLANPITHITKNTPPFLILHGDKDTLVPLSQSQMLEKALKAANVPVTLFVAVNQGHAITGSEMNRAVQEFLDRNLKK